MPSTDPKPLSGEPYQWTEHDVGKLFYTLGQITGQLGRVIELLESPIARRGKEENCDN